MRSLDVVVSVAAALAILGCAAPQPMAQTATKQLSTSLQTSTEQLEAERRQLEQQRQQTLRQQERAKQLRVIRMAVTRQ